VHKLRGPTFKGREGRDRRERDWREKGGKVEGREKGTCFKVLGWDRCPWQVVTVLFIIIIQLL